MKRRDFLKVLPLMFISLSKAKNINYMAQLEPKSAVAYQDHPNNGQMCCMCIHFIPPPGMKDMMQNGCSHMNTNMMSNMMMGGGMMHAKCNVVAGDISPMGWCKLFQFRRKEESKT